MKTNPVLNTDCASNYVTFSLTTLCLRLGNGLAFLDHIVENCQVTLYSLHSRPAQMSDGKEACQPTINRIVCG